MAILAHLLGADASLDIGWRAARHAAIASIYRVPLEVSILGILLTLAPSELDEAFFMHHVMKLTVMCETIKMLAFVCWPDLCVTCHTKCSSTTKWSLNNGVLMLERD
eukprot:6470639-Amphidinium_carterae.1